MPLDVFRAGYRGQVKDAPSPPHSLAGKGSAETVARSDHTHLVKIGPFTTSGTPGTRTSHNHGLPATPTVVLIVPTAADDDSDNAFANPVSFVKAGATTITVKCHVASATFLAYVQ